MDIRKQVSDNQTRLADVTNRVSGFFTQLKTGGIFWSSSEKQEIQQSCEVNHEKDKDATQQNGTQQNDEDENQQSKLNHEKDKDATQQNGAQQNDEDENQQSKRSIEIKVQKIENRMSEPEFKRAHGIIFIVGIFGADGTAKDVENVESTFRELQFAVYIERDPTSEEIAHLMAAAAKCTYPYRYRYVAFYFAGHGGRDESGKPYIKGLQAQESMDEILHIEEYIINPLKELSLTRMFFFDCCQSQGTGNAYRDSNTIVKNPKPHPGELIAYATSEGKKSFGDQNHGGIWTHHFCKNLMKLDSIVSVLAQTYDDVVKERNDFQEPMTICKVGTIVLKVHEESTDDASDSKHTDSLIKQHSRGGSSSATKPITHIESEIKMKEDNLKQLSEENNRKEVTTNNPEYGKVGRVMIDTLQIASQHPFLTCFVVGILAATICFMWYCVFK